MKILFAPTGVRSRLAIAGTVLAMAIGFANQASATPILDTIQGDTYVPSTGYFVDSNQSVALPFTPSSAVNVLQIEAYIGMTQCCGSVELGIMADSGGLPSGIFLASQNIVLSDAPVEISNLDVALVAGTQYWLAAISDIQNVGFAQWQSNSNIPTGLVALTSDSQDTGWTSSDASLPEALITGTGATPLPATLPLFAGGLGLVGFLSKRRRNAK